MTRLLRTVSLICSSIVASSDCIGAEPFPTEDAAVLSAIITNRCEYAASQSDKHYQVLSAQAPVVDHVPSSKDLDPNAMISLLSRNKTAHELPVFSLCPAYKLAPQDKIEGAMAQDGWRGFYRAFPNAGGISYLSLPGYSVDGNVAIVEVSGSCDALCGSGFFWVMRKVDGKWIFYKSVSGWIS